MHFLKSYKEHPLRSLLFLQTAYGVYSLYQTCSNDFIYWDCFSQGGVTIYSIGLSSIENIVEKSIRLEKTMIKKVIKGVVSEAVNLFDAGQIYMT